MLVTSSRTVDYLGTFAARSTSVSSARLRGPQFSGSVGHVPRQGAALNSINSLHFTLPHNLLSAAYIFQRSHLQEYRPILHWITKHQHAISLQNQDKSTFAATTTISTPTVDLHIPPAFELCGSYAGRPKRRSLQSSSCKCSSGSKPFSSAFPKQLQDGPATLQFSSSSAHQER